MINFDSSITGYEQALSAQTCRNKSCHRHIPAKGIAGVSGYLPCLSSRERCRPGPLAILVQKLAPQQTAGIIRNSSQPLFRSLLLLAVQLGGFRGCSGTGGGIFLTGHFRRLLLMDRLPVFSILRVPGIRRLAGSGILFTFRTGVCFARRRLPGSCILLPGLAGVTGLRPALVRLL
jgi:hypothetical protein